jgi:uncharacterized protein (DUF433 family)
VRNNLQPFFSKSYQQFYTMHIKEIITAEKEILGGLVVFNGTRVPVETLFDHLKASVALDDFTTIAKEQQ